MIDLYYGPTPNGQKVSVMLEECALPYKVHYIDMLGGDQFTAEYLKICPNNKQPAIVDPAGPDGKPLTLWESGAILIYLGEKTGKLIPADPVSRAHCLQWLMFQMAGIGPMFGQLHHFVQYAPDKIPYAIERYRKEGNRLRHVLDNHLADHEYLADEYSIADIASYTWIRGLSRRYPTEQPTPHMDRWVQKIGERPAVKAGMALLKDNVRPEARGEKKVDEQTWNVLFGTVQHGVR